MLKNLKKKKKGFTLIELIIVIAIIAILAAIALPKFGQVKREANAKADLANAKTISNAAIALVAEGKLTQGETASEVVKVKSTADTNGKKVAEYLQSVPTLKSETGNFIVEVQSNGDVVVKSTTKIYYPEGATITTDTTKPGKPSPDKTGNDAVEEQE